MSDFDRAPDNQPTESIRRMLAAAKRDQYEWERTLTAAKATVVRLTGIEDRARRKMQSLQRQLAIRLSEEGEAPQEVNGL